MGALPNNDLVSTNCIKRVKPTLLRDVKTEALLVFARTALERYFAQLDQASLEVACERDESAEYVYNVLQSLLQELQSCVVNVDYLINVAHNAKRHQAFKLLLKQEEPLMAYYDVMAQQVRNHFAGETVYLPVFLVLSVLAEWILGEEKSMHYYPFLAKIDFLELIGRFEEKRDNFYQGDSCKISEIHELSFKIVQRLKSYKFKTNKRVSKTRRK